MYITRYPKIYALGHREIKAIFDDPMVELTEKVDGSQFKFKRDGEDGLICESKGSFQPIDEPDALFKPAVEYLKKFIHHLHYDLEYYGETLARPRHNVLTYNRIPKNHIALFGAHHVLEDRWLSHVELQSEAETIGIETVPLLYLGEMPGSDPFAIVQEHLETESFLGGPKIEGVVVKNYNRSFLVADVYHPFMAGKFVSEAFKETHDKNAYGRRKKRLTWDDFMESYRTEARWQKAVQHLRDDGQLLGEPKDIGGLIQEVKRDILDEEQEEIKDFLWKNFGQELLRKSTAGLPEWYKEQLAKGLVNIEEYVCPKCGNFDAAETCSCTSEFPDYEDYH